MYIEPYLTARIKADIRELSVGDCIHLASLPTERNVLGVCEMVERIVENTTLPLSQWTYQEVIGAALHYTYYAVYKQHDVVIDANTGSTLLEYAFSNQDYPTSIANRVVTADDYIKSAIVLDVDSENPDYLSVFALNMDMAKAVENVVLNGHVEGLTQPSESWLIGLMAAQIQNDAFTYEHVHNGVAFEEQIIENIKTFVQMPISSYQQVRSQFLTSLIEIDHIVALRPFFDGLVLERIGGDEAAAPFRFCSDAIVKEGAPELFEGLQKPIGYDAD